MGNAIIFSRVSTNAQSTLEEQERTLVELAKKDGYQEDNLIFISYKESARKLSEEERLGINELKEKIDTDDISCIYAFSVSRLARRKDTLFSLERLLVDKKIQLVIKEPSIIRLLNEDGTVNDTMELVFSLFGQLSESEMRIKLARTALGKKKSTKTGKFVGGLVRFGYCVDSQKFLKVDEDNTAPIVRLIYKLYVEDRMSIHKIYKELKERGEQYNLSIKNIHNILSNPLYYGKTDEETGRVWEGIISKELYDKAEKIRKENTLVADKSRSYYFGNRLIVCEKCGGHYTTANNCLSYQCYNSSNRHIKYSTPSRNYIVCDNRETVNLNVFDSCAWNTAVILETLSSMNDDEARKKELAEKKTVLEQKISSVNLDVFASRIEKTTESYIDGLISKEKRDSKISEIKEEEKQCLNSLNKWKEQITAIDEALSRTDILTLADLVAILEKSEKSNNYEEMYNIIHKHLSKATVKDVVFKGHKAKKICFYSKATGDIISTYYHLYTKRHIVEENGHILWNWHRPNVDDSFIFIKRVVSKKLKNVSE